MSATIPPRPEDLVGCTVANRYRVESAIGDGGMATVYRGTQVHLRRPVALKVLKSRYCGDPNSVERFVREARAASSIRSPHVVDILDVGEITGSSVYIVMELLEGPTLEELMQAYGALAWPRAQRLALQIVRGLRAVHDHGIVHRDMKPSNCIVTKDDRGEEHIKILDFGIAKMSLAASDHALTQTGAIFGTAKYMSPEQARGLPVDPRTDIYAFGVILFEMLAGRVPFDGDSFPQVATQHVRDQPPSLDHLQLPPGVQTLVRRCLAKRPEERFHSMQALEAELEGLGAPGPPRHADRRPRASAATARPGSRPVPEGTLVLQDGGLPPGYRQPAAAPVPERTLVIGAPAGADTDAPPPAFAPVHAAPSWTPSAPAGQAAEQTNLLEPFTDEPPPANPPQRIPWILCISGMAVFLCSVAAWFWTQESDIDELATDELHRPRAARVQPLTPAPAPAATRLPPPSVAAAGLAAKAPTPPAKADPPAQVPKADPPKPPAAPPDPPQEPVQERAKPKIRDKTRNKTSRRKPTSASRKANNTPARGYSAKVTQRSLASARRLVRSKCGGPGLRAVVKTEISVDPDGSIRSVQALAPFDQSEIGACVQRYARLARFPALNATQPTLVRESFALSASGPDRGSSDR